MKYIVPLICLLQIAIATPALALQGSECLANSKKLSPAERESFMKTCLAQAREPGNVKAEERKQKSAQCEQNAKNKKLQGSDKARYHDECLNRNDAATLSQSTNKTAPASKSAEKSTVQIGQHKPATVKKHSSNKQSAKKKKSHKKTTRKVEKPTATGAEANQAK